MRTPSLWISILFLVEIGQFDRELDTRSYINLRMRWPFAFFRYFVNAEDGEGAGEDKANVNATTALPTQGEYQSKMLSFGRGPGQGFD